MTPRPLRRLERIRRPLRHREGDLLLEEAVVVMVVVIHRQWEGVLLQEEVVVVVHRQWEGVLFQEVVVALGMVALRRLERIRRWWQGFLLQATIWL